MPEHSYYQQIMDTVERKLAAFEASEKRVHVAVAPQTAELINIGRFLNNLLKVSVAAELEAKRHLAQTTNDLTLRTGHLTSALQILAENHLLDDFQTRANANNPDGPLVLDLRGLTAEQRDSLAIREST